MTTNIAIRSALAVVLVLAGLFFATRTYFAPAAELPSLVEEQRAAHQAGRLLAVAGVARHLDGLIGEQLIKIRFSSNSLLLKCRRMVALRHLTLRFFSAPLCTV